MLVTSTDVNSPILDKSLRNSQPKNVRGCPTHVATDEIAWTLFYLVLSPRAYPRVTPVPHVAVLRTEASRISSLNLAACAFLRMAPSFLLFLSKNRDTAMDGITKQDLAVASID